jgi:3-dehydroquinate dehydratase-2
MTPRILFLNGPGTNLYGLDVEGTYGTESFPQIEARLLKQAATA